MALSDEWEEEHLTPDGWVSGSYKHDYGIEVVKARPDDAVLTVRRHVYVPTIGAPPKVTETETPHVDDRARIAMLRAQHGDPTFGV